VTTSTEVLRALKPLADLQAGVVTREQASAHGVSPRVVARLLDEGHWRRLERGVFFTADLAPPFVARAWVGTLLGGDDARVGDLAAARLHGLADEDPDRVIVLVPHTQRPAPRRGYEFVRERAGTRGRSVGAPPRTTVEDTVLDLCTTARPEDVVGWVTVAVERRRTTAKRLRRTLAGRRRHPRRDLLEGLLADVAVGVRSPLEMTYLRDVERAHGLSALVSRQLPSRDEKAVRDVWYTQFGVVVELDGRLGHTELGRFRDMDRDNEASLDGLLTLRFGAGDLHGQPCRVAAKVARALHQRGWSGLPTRCRRCRLVPEREWG
jgi:very-short-patch-repair endonuclease